MQLTRMPGRWSRAGRKGCRSTICTTCSTLVIGGLFARVPGPTPGLPRRVHPVGIYHVRPPIVEHPVGLAFHVWQMAVPPEGVPPDLAVAPLAAIDRPSATRQGWEGVPSLAGAAP